MSGFVNLDIDIINQHIGQEIEYYELWDPEQSDFKRGRSFLHGTYLDSDGNSRLYADLIWGDSLDESQEEDGGFCFPGGSFIYLAPEPFQLFKISWINDLGMEEEKIIPVDTLIDVDFTARLFTSNQYQAIRINLDGSNYNHFSS